MTLTHRIHALRWRASCFTLASVVGCVGDNRQMSDAKLGTPLPPNAAGQWVMPAHDYASPRYSELTQINARNARHLRVGWTSATGVLRGPEGQQLVMHITMY